MTHELISNWTRDNLVRQVAFKGLREDKSPPKVIRETTAAPENVKFDSSPRPRKKQALHSHRNGNTAMKNPALAITHPDKVLDVASAMTKQALAEYYAAVAANLLPHIADRPLSVVRCPEGDTKPCFFQKHVGFGLPAGVKSISIQSRKSGKSEDFLTVDSIEGLIGLAQIDVLEIHAWGSRNEYPDKPDRIIFDLDPDAPIDWNALAETAKELKKRFKKAGLESFLKSTGGKGLHVVAPIRPNHEWKDVKEFAHNLVLELENDQPNLYVTKMTKASRKNRIYLDYLRNDRGSTAVAPYSPRSRPGAPVVMPLRWNELNSARAPSFHVSDFVSWRSRLSHDPWLAMLKTGQELPAG